jgi:O-antigen/teichoic acid export membrane protein
MQDKPSTIKKLLSDFYSRVLINVRYVKESIGKNFDLPLVKNASHLMVGAGLQSSLTFIFWIIAARLFVAAEVGLTTALLSVLSIFAIVAELGFGMGLIRFLPGAGEKENDLINTCFTISSLVATLLAILFIIGLPVWGQTFIPLFSSPVFIVLFMIFSVVMTLQPLLNNIFLGKRTTKFIVFTTTINCVSRIAFLLVIIFFAHSVFGLFFISFLSTFAGLFIGLSIFLPTAIPTFRLLPTIHLGVLQEIRNYSVVNYISRLILQITPLIFPLMVVNILGSAMNAYFAMSWTIVAIMQVIPTSLFNSFLAESATEKKLNKKNFRKVLVLMLELLIPATLAVILLAGLILSVFGAAYAEQGTTLVRILALSIIPWGIIYLFITVERYKKSSLSIIFATLASAVLSLGLSYLMMSAWGLIGLGIGYLTGQVIVALIAGILMWRMMDKDQFERSDSPNDLNHM